MKNKENDEWFDKISENIDELSDNISGMFNSLQIISGPIKESSEKVPEASEHLEKITEQTELATNQILDQLEIMTERNGTSLDSLKKYIDSVGEDKIDKSLKTLLNDFEAATNSNIDDGYVIMDALQFQDITSQKIGYINNMLKEIEFKLQSLLNILGSATKIKMFESQSHYDGNAEFVDAADKQAVADNVFKGDNKEE